jgi:hypothetical protein
MILRERLRKALFPQHTRVVILPHRNHQHVLRRACRAVGIDPEIDEIGLRRRAAGQRGKEGEAEKETRAHGKTPPPASVQETPATERV